MHESTGGKGEREPIRILFFSYHGCYHYRHHSSLRVLYFPSPFPSQIELAQRILSLAQVSRKYETEQEKVTPFGSVGPQAIAAELKSKTRSKAKSKTRVKSITRASVDDTKGQGEEEQGQGENEEVGGIEMQMQLKVEITCWVALDYTRETSRQLFSLVLPCLLQARPEDASSPLPAASLANQAAEDGQDENEEGGDGEKEEGEEEEEEEDISLK